MRAFTKQHIIDILRAEHASESPWTTMEWIAGELRKITTDQNVSSDDVRVAFGEPDFWSDADGSIIEWDEVSDTAAAIPTFTISSAEGNVFYVNGAVGCFAMITDRAIEVFDVAMDASPKKGELLYSYVGAPTRVEWAHVKANLMVAYAIDVNDKHMPAFVQ